MGVTCVFPVPVVEGCTSNQVIDSLKARLGLLGADKAGSWFVECEAFHSVKQNQENVAKMFYLMHSSECPSLSFSLLENDTCVVAENSINSIISKLSDFYLPRKGSKTEAKGSRFTLGDFIIKIGTITQASSFKGVVAEIHYAPCSDPLQCWCILDEFVRDILAVNVTLPSSPKTLVDKKSNLFSAADTIVQYLEIIKNTKRV
ncbi:mediator of RNA polymerase II transcription subunit 20-like isoform X2 [Hydra vulgaris]|uniref:Mediator of RNA polymerase II transcription subunit 20 n=1 Tax=Hydra vulgaris TaxID=6087 RepID=A0ABM4DH91_HYDVU